MRIDKELDEEIKEYCRINLIKNVNEFMNRLLRTQFTIEKYGEIPFSIEKKSHEEKKSVEIKKETENNISSTDKKEKDKKNKSVSNINSNKIARANKNIKIIEN